MSSSTYETLVQAGFVPVQELAARKILTTIEKGKRYALQISNSKESVLYQVDGNIITAKNNGKDYFGKVIELDFKFRTLLIK